MLKDKDISLEKFIELTPAGLNEINNIYGWSLNEKELLMIKSYFKKLKRNPTRGEIETIAQTWSEHCKHKTFGGPVELTEIKNGKKKVKKFKNLFKETIVYATKKLNKKYCLSVFEDNAGVVEFDEKWALCFKAETHNHPCAIEPYGGAETGIGGVIRDILGVGLGAKPILNTDNFCFAFTDKKYKIETGFLSPNKIVHGVVSGIRDYGNKMGIPTAAGSVFFDDSYLYNPLVYAGCVGIMPRDKIKKKVKPGSLIVVIGGETGRDGIGGATFSSADITDETSSSHVQIGNAINEKKLLDVMLKARDRNLYTAVTDCGAGGFSSAVGELASECGAVVKLENAVLKDKNIEPWEIWLSESQERMVLCVEKKNLEEIARICEIEDCLYYVIGEFTNDKKLRVYYKDQMVVNLDMDFLHQGLPKIEKKAFYTHKKMVNKIRPVKDLKNVFKKVISDLNVASKRWIVEQYDHEVMAQTVMKPFPKGAGSSPSDCCVIWPANVCGELNKYRGFAVSHGIKPSLSYISPYDMSFYVIDEAIRNLVCAGANIETAAILDNFCLANPNIKEVMGEFTLAALGVRDAAIYMKVPFISGKDSFYNQTKIRWKDYKIPATLLVSAIAIVEDIRKVITPHFKESGAFVYVAGGFKKGLGASVYSRLFERDNNFIEPIDLKLNRRMYLKLIELMNKDYIISAHDISDGGFISGVSEMCFDGKGVEIDISAILDKYNLEIEETLFGECGSRIMIEVKKGFETEVEKELAGFELTKVGFVIDRPLIELKAGDKELMNASAEEIKNEWERL